MPYQHPLLQIYLIVNLLSNRVNINLISFGSFAAFYSNGRLAKKGLMLIFELKSLLKFFHFYVLVFVKTVPGYRDGFLFEFGYKKFLTILESLNRVLHL